jgi:hypothetical protein
VVWRCKPGNFGDKYQNKAAPESIPKNSQIIAWTMGFTRIAGVPSYWSLYAGNYTELKIKLIDNDSKT